MTKATWKQARVPVAGPLRSRCNRLAHQWATRYEADTLRELVARLTALADGGARLQDLHAELDRLEAEPGPPAGRTT